MESFREMLNFKFPRNGKSALKSAFRFHNSDIFEIFSLQVPPQNVKNILPPKKHKKFSVRRLDPNHGFLKRQSKHQNTQKRCFLDLFC